MLKFPVLIQRLVNKRLAFSFLLSITLFILSLSNALFTVPEASAQGYNVYQNNLLDQSLNPDVPKNLNTSTQALLISIISAANCQLIGVDPVNPQNKCLGVDPQTGKLGFVENGGGAIGAMSYMIGMLYTPPIHTSDYFTYLSSNFGISKQAHAQRTGMGFDSLSPLVNLWSYFRNVVYVFFALVFLIIGIAIMLRIKIDPRTVMSIENQIPKIIIGIVLVTFSLAIVGVIIDFMYLIIYISFDILTRPEFFKNADHLDQIKNGMQTFNSDSAIASFNNFIGVWSLADHTGGAISKLILEIVGKGNPISDFVNMSIGIGPASFKPFEGIFKGIGIFIAFIAILWALFRVWFALIMAYINIFLDIALAPFWIITGILPGGGLGFGAWLKDLISAVMAFPTVIVLFLMGRVFMDSVDKGDLFVPPLVGNFNNTDVFASLIGFGTVLLAPKAVEYMKAALKAPKFDFTPIKQAIGAGSPTGMLGSASQLGSTYFGLSNLGKMTHLPSQIAARFGKGAKKP